MDNGLNFGIGLDTTQLDAQTQHVKRQFESMGVSASDAGSKIDDAFKGLGRVAVSFFSLAGAADFARQIVRVRGEIESLEVSFKTLLGDEEKAVSLMSDIRKFAAQTPMQMDDLAAGAQTLLAFNIEAEKVMPILRALGDVSMGDSQKFQSLTLAFSQMSSTGRLMGQDLMQMVNAGFNPLAQISEKTGKSIGELKEEMSKGKISVDMVTQAFMDATSEGGKFYGMLEKQSHGIQGSFSNLQGAVQDMLNEIGEKVQEPVVSAFNALQGLVQNYEKVGKVIAALVATYGGYKAAVMAVTAVEKIAARVELEMHLAKMNGIAITKAQAAATLLQKDATLLLTKAQKMLNATMLRNPYVLAATAIVGLVTAIIALRDRSTEAERAQAALQRTVEANAARQDAVKEETDKLIQTLDDENATSAEHIKALDRLKKLYPELLVHVKTYNDYLQQRKEILEGMPEAQESKETEDEHNDLQRLKTDYEEILRLRGKWQRSNNGSTASSEYAEYRNAWDKYKQQAEEAGYKSLFGANDDDVLQYLKDTLDAYEQTIKERMEEIRHAQWVTKPIEQRIEITQTAIDNAKKQVADAKAAAEKEPWNPVLKLNISIAEQQLAELQNQAQALADEKPVAIRINLGKAVEDAKKVLAQAQKKFRDDQSETNKKAVEDAQAELDQANKNYKLAYGKEYDQVVKAGKDKLKAQKEANRALEREQEEYAEWLSNQAAKAVRDRRQAEIDAMKESLDKTLEQIKLDYDTELAAIDAEEKAMVDRLRAYKEKEWEAQHQEEKKNGEHFDRSTITAKDLEEAQQTQITEARERALAKRQRMEQESLKDTLRDYRTYQQQRLDIEEEYARKVEALYEHDENGNRMGLREGVTAEQVANMQQEGRNRQAELESEELKRSVAYAKFFSSYLVLGADNVRKTAELVKNDLNRQLQAGTITIEQWANGLADVDDIVKRASDRMGGLRAAIDGGVSGLAEYQSELGSQQMAAAQEDYKQAQADFNAAVIAGNKEAMDAAEAQMRAAKAQEEAGRKMKDTADGILDAVSAAKSVLELTMKVGEVLGTVKDEVIKVAASFGADTDSLIADIANVSVDSVGHAMDAGSKLLNGDVFGALQELVKYVSSAISGINSIIDGERNRTIKGLMSDIDGLEKEYDNLGKAIETAFGSSKSNLIREQGENLRKQIELLKQAREEEESKKATDTDKLQEYDDRIEESTERLEALKQSEIDAIFGQDVQSAIEQLGDAVVDAWSRGENAAKAFSESARSWVKQALAEIVKDYIKQAGYVESIRKKIQEALTDENITDDEWRDILATSEQLGRQLDEALRPVSDRLRQIGQEEQRQGATKGIAAASQDSVNELNGRATAIQGHTYSIMNSSAAIAESTRMLLGVSNDILGTVRHIDTNTTDMRSLMGNLADDMQTVRRSISYIETNGVKMRR